MTLYPNLSTRDSKLFHCFYNGPVEFVLILTTYLEFGKPIKHGKMNSNPKMITNLPCVEQYMPLLCGGRSDHSMCQRVMVVSSQMPNYDLNLLI